MKVGEMIKKLQEFPEDMEVIITDGFQARFYSGDYYIGEFEGAVDIGIGGCEEYYNA